MSTESLAVVVHENAPVHVPVNAAERGHHPYSPSTLQSLEACPCWVGKQSKVLHPRTVIGTLSHIVTDTGEDNPELTDEDLEKAAECMDFYESRRQIFIAARAKAVQELEVKYWGAPVPEGKPADVTVRAEQEVPGTIELKETYLPVDDLVFPDAQATTAGYIDCALISHNRTYAEAFDWKFGMWPVEQAENNLQGISYTLGMFKKYPALERVQFFFKQPNIGVIDSHTFTRENLPALYLRVQVVVARAREARARIGNKDWSMARPMIPACNFCKHISTCPKVVEAVCKVGSKFFPLEIPADITPTQVHNPADTTLGLRLAGVVEVWAKAFKATITDRVIRRDAECPEGFKLEVRTPRSIVDEGKYRTSALKHLTPEEYNGTLKASFGKVEDLISDKAPRGHKQAAVDAFGKELEETGAVVRGTPYVFLKAVAKKK